MIGELARMSKTTRTRPIVEVENLKSGIHIRDSHRLGHLTTLNGQVGIGLGVGGDLQRNIGTSSINHGTNRIAYAHIGLLDGNAVKVEVIARNHRRIAGIGKLILQTVDFQLRNRYRERF